MCPLVTFFPQVSLRFPLFSPTSFPNYHIYVTYVEKPRMELDWGVGDGGAH